MVVSYQKKAVFILCVLCCCLMPLICEADTRPLTDEELDEIVAANYSVSATQLLSVQNEVQAVTDQILALIEPVIDPANISASQLVYIHAIASEILVQTNLLIIDHVEGLNLHQTNFYQTDN